MFYGFGDASGKQFGATLSQNYNCKAQNCRRPPLLLGVCGAEEEESLNFKELKNLMDTVDKEAKAGWMQNCEFFLFTDNSTAESCFYRGSSKSRHLHALVLALRTLEEMAHGMTIHVIHVENDSSRHGWMLERLVDGGSDDGT